MGAPASFTRYRLYNGFRSVNRPFLSCDWLREREHNTPKNSAVNPRHTHIVTLLPPPPCLHARCPTAPSATCSQAFSEVHCASSCPPTPLPLSIFCKLVGGSHAIRRVAGQHQPVAVCKTTVIASWDRWFMSSVLHHAMHCISSISHRPKTTEVVLVAR